MAGAGDPGWYPDPYDERVERWWDGTGWVGDPHDRPAEHRSAVAVEVDPGPDRAGIGSSRTLGRQGLWPLITATAGAGLVVGSFLPWTTLTGTFGEHASVTGTHSGTCGWVAVALGAVVAAAGLWSLPRPRRGATIGADVASLAAAVLMSYEFLHRTAGTGVFSASNSTGIWDVGLGGGLALGAVAAVVSLIGAAGLTGRDARAEQAL